MPRPDHRHGPLPLVLIPGAGGIEPHISKLIRICESHGETLVLDYPVLQWTLQHADLRCVAAEMHGRIRDRMARRPFVLVGVSLGAIVASLIVRHGVVRNDGAALNIARVVGVDPVGSMDHVEIETGWLGRNIARARRAGLWGSFQGSPGYLWVRVNRAAAIILARCLRRNIGMARSAAWLITCAGLRRFSHELRMRWLIDTAAMWRRDPARHRDRVTASKVPCAVFHTSATRFDAGFWERHFDSVGVTTIGGNHDTWYDFDGPRRLIGEWDAASEQVAPPSAGSGFGSGFRSDSGA